MADKLAFSGCRRKPGQVELLRSKLLRTARRPSAPRPRRQGGCGATVSGVYPLRNGDIGFKAASACELSLSEFRRTEPFSQRATEPIAEDGIHMYPFHSPSHHQA